MTIEEKMITDEVIVLRKIQAAGGEMFTEELNTRTILRCGVKGYIELIQAGELEIAKLTPEGNLYLSLNGGTHEFHNRR